MVRVQFSISILIIYFYSYLFHLSQNVCCTVDIKIDTNYADLIQIVAPQKVGSFVVLDNLINSTYITL